MPLFCLIFRVGKERKIRWQNSKNRWYFRAFPVCRNYTVRAYRSFHDDCQRCGSCERSRRAWTCYRFHNIEYLRPPGGKGPGRSQRHPRRRFRSFKTGMTIARTRFSSPVWANFFVFSDFESRSHRRILCS